MKSNFAGSEGEAQSSRIYDVDHSLGVSDVSAFYDKVENVMGYSCLQVDGERTRKKLPSRWIDWRWRGAVNPRKQL